MEQETYEPPLRADLSAINKKVLERIAAAHAPRSLSDTRTICYFYLQAIAQIISGAYAALSVRDLLCVRSLQRSIVEYLLDLMLVAGRNNQTFNRRFADYHKATLFLRRDMLDHYRDQIPRLQNDFFEALASSYKDHCTSQTSGTQIVRLQDVEKDMRRDLIKKGWTLYNFEEKLRAVYVESVVGPTQGTEALSIWGKAESQITRESDEWRELSHMNKVDRVLKVIQSQHSKPAVGVAALDPCFYIVMKSYKFSSEFIHPTPRAVVPHLNMQTGDFELKYAFTDKSLDDAGEEMWLLYSAAINSSHTVFPKIDGITLKEFFYRQCAKSSAMRSMFAERLGNHDAASPRDE